MRKFTAAELRRGEGRGVVYCAPPLTAQEALAGSQRAGWRAPNRSAAIIAGSDSGNAGCPDHRARAARGGSRSLPPRLDGPDRARNWRPHSGRIETLAIVGM